MFRFSRVRSTFIGAFAFFLGKCLILSIGELCTLSGRFDLPLFSWFSVLTYMTFSLSIQLSVVYLNFFVVPGAEAQVAAAKVRI